jgi:hypothetical protein
MRYRDTFPDDPALLDLDPDYAEDIIGHLTDEMEKDIDELAKGEWRYA